MNPTKTIGFSSICIDFFGLVKGKFSAISVSESEVKNVQIFAMKPDRSSYILHGPPGSGKSSFAYR
ncbi:MAG: hypothetical protein ACYCOU_08525, partial [Sulfobacillus sp.]